MTLSSITAAPLREMADLASKYPALECHVTAVPEGLQLRLRYSPSVPQGRLGTFLRALDQQGKLAQLMSIRLMADFGIEAETTEAGSLRIAVNAYASLAAAECLVVAFDAVLQAIAAQRTDLMLVHGLGSKSGPHTPYLAQADTPVVPESSGCITLLSGTRGPDSMLECDASLVTCDARELDEAASWLATVLMPFRLPPCMVRGGQRIWRVETVWCTAADQVTQAAALVSGARSVALPGWLAHGASGGTTRAYDGQACANWVLIKAVAAALDQAQHAGCGDAVEVNGDAAAFRPFVQYLEAIRGRARDSVQIGVLVLLPGATIETTALAERRVIVDLFGVAASYWATGEGDSMPLLGAFLSLDGESLHFDAGLVCGSQYALVEALLDTPLADAAEFAASAAVRGLRIEAWRGRDGMLVRADWDTFRSLPSAWRRRFGAGADVTCTAWQARVAEPSNVCNFIFVPEHLTSEAYLIDPASGASLSYAALYELARCYAHGLHASGLVRGDVLAVAAPDDLRLLALMLACLMGGWVFCPINYLAAPSSVETMLAVAQPQLLLFGSDERCARLRAPAPGESIALDTFIEEMRAVSTQHFPVAQLPWDWPAVILFTSGSTGTPKAVHHTHSDFIACQENYARYIVQLSAQDCVYTPSRIFFAYGLNNLIASLCAGASHVLASPLAQHQNAVEIVQRYRVSVVFAVPAMYKLMLAARSAASEFPGLRLCVSAGETLPPRLYHEMRDAFGVAVLDGIGATEVLSTFVSTRPGDTRPGCTGVLVPGFEAELRRADGALCRVGEVGTLWVRGNTVRSGYLNDPALNAQVFVDGWFNTSDMFYVDFRRRFYYVGRAGRVLKINGCWFSPQMMEMTLQTHPAVGECAVCVVSDDYGLARPKAFVVLARDYDGRAGLEALWQELRRLAKEKMGKDHYPHLFAAVAQLPRTGSGKLNVSELVKT